MVKPIDTAARHPFVLPEDRDLPEDQQTVWEFRVPTAREQAHIDDRSSAWEQGDSSGAKMVTRDGEALYWPLKIGLVSVTRFGDVKWADEPNRIDPHAPPLVTDAVLSRIRPHHRRALGLEASRLASLTDTDVGNSSPPPTSTTGSSQAPADDAGGEGPGAGAQEPQAAEA